MRTRIKASLVAALATALLALTVVTAAAKQADVRVVAPGTRVVANGDRVRVQAPLTRVKVDGERGQVRVRAPYAFIDIRW